MLEKTNQVVTIDRELLLWAAAGRWLMRNNIYELQKAVLKKYSNISRQLSNGKSGDALNIFEGDDLQD